MRARAAILALAAAAMTGCTVSREIIELQAPPQPPLQELERHLDYVDPDDGKPDYIIERRG